MIEEAARVVDVRDNVVWVETQRRSTCERCSVAKGCGTAVLAKVMGRKRSVIRAVNNADACIGDDVILGLSESALIRGSLAVYGAPLASMFLFALLGEWVNNHLLLLSHDMASIVFGMAGLVAGLFWLRWFGDKIREDIRFQPVILRRIETNGAATRALF
ncbi:MAG: sigma-E factor negative regulatory protein RseC [Gammaproteobacteria bacterium]|nr:MAG: sigma-E factor negative regulatory protein RseC [Gammaproteobacteria bacterium]TND06926.1 MAG: sigma-E factor negative regulatory protein RseC [Gammaproteobacteria bacterium]